MKALEPEALWQIGGGRTYFNNDGEDPPSAGDALSMMGATVVPIYTVNVSSTYAAAEQARTDYANMQAASAWIAAAAGIGATAVVTGACVAIPTALSGPAAPEVAALVSRPCTYIGGLGGAAFGVWVNGVLKAGLEMY